MDPWPIGVFASVDAGLGVAWNVIAELRVPTIQLHAPHPEKRNQQSAAEFNTQLRDMGVQCTAVFGDLEHLLQTTLASRLGNEPDGAKATRISPRSFAPSGSFPRRLAKVVCKRCSKSPISRNG